MMSRWDPHNPPTKPDAIYDAFVGGLPDLKGKHIAITGWVPRPAFFLEMDLLHQIYRHLSSDGQRCWGDSCGPFCQISYSHHTHSPPYFLPTISRTLPSLLGHPLAAARRGPATSRRARARSRAQMSWCSTGSRSAPTRLLPRSSSPSQAHPELTPPMRHHGRGRGPQAHKRPSRSLPPPGRRLESQL